MQRPISPTRDLEEDERGYLLASEQEDESNNVLASIGTEKDVPAPIRWINFALGAAVLLPWNGIITALPYFLSRLSGSRLQSTFSSYLSVTFNITNLFFMGHAATAEQGKSSRTIRRSLVMITLLNLVLTCSTFFTLSPIFFSLFVILNGMLQASAGAYLQSSVVAVASLFGPLAIQPVMSGYAAVGVLVSLIQVLTTLAGIRKASILDAVDEEEAARGAFLFFASSTLFLLSTLVLHSWLLTMPAFRSVVIPYEASKNLIRVDEDRGTLVADRNVDDHKSLASARRDHIIEVGKMNLEYNVAIGYVYLVTLSVFPPVTSSIRSVHYPPDSLFSHPLMFTSIHFLLFNVGDLLGRYLPMIRCLQTGSSRWLLYMSLGRTLFIPLFLLCNVQNPSSPLAAPPDGVIINSDTLFFTILLFFGITNGYISSLIMMVVPSTQHNPRLKNRPEDVDRSATIAQFFTVAGLVIGSFTSFGVKGLVCGCNPFTS
ncbi:nucleoside transporter-domain-containing protein [Hysterangium stoloniferum]|nr:nucleoside transporter-domain-containing protein [Hysterangium stoloniferum]